MAFEAPSSSDLREVARQLGLDLTDTDLGEFREVSITACDPPGDDGVQQVRGVAENGSWMVRRFPLAAKVCEKSPAFCNSVGRVSVRNVCWRWRRPSYASK